MSMFCFQCEQTAGGKGCSVMGVCGKNADVSALQDLIIYLLKGISFYADMARKYGVMDEQVDLFVLEGMFTTVTNVDFDPQRLSDIIRKGYEVKEHIKLLFLDAFRRQEKKDFVSEVPSNCRFQPADDLAGLISQGQKVGIMFPEGENEDKRSLKWLLTYGLKGLAAYADHAYILGESSQEVLSFLHKALAALAVDDLSIEGLISLNMECGQVNLKCMEILDKANTGHFGAPVPTKVSLGARKGPAILISGHDLLDLEELLKQSQDKGVNVYTHGEMLPAHGYPGLNKYKHLAGNYGAAWQDQQKEFAIFPGPILMTTNCIQKPAESYSGRIYTTGLVAWPGVKHIEGKGRNKDFSSIIRQAVEIGGFKEDYQDKSVTVGFARQAVMGVADKVIEAVKTGKIRRFFLIGGCDGAKSGRNYYTDFAQKVPKDCVILTLACGKYRFNKLEFGDIQGIPRLLDCGQCNDAYSAIQIASALAAAFNCGVNDLPLSLILSWYEQKAVCILLTLLSLGITNIRLGPSLPAFVSPGVLKVLVEKFAVKPISTVDEDMKAALAGK